MRLWYNRNNENIKVEENNRSVSQKHEQRKKQYHLSNF